jgi:hypothetical protein
MILAYIGPESILPLLSLVAGIAGAGLMLGRRAIAPILRLFVGLRGPRK